MAFNRDFLLEKNYKHYTINDLFNRDINKGIVFSKNLMELENIRKRNQTDIYKISSCYNYIFRQLLKECSDNQIFKFLIVGDVGTLKSSLARTIKGYLEFYLKQNKKKLINVNNICFDNRELFFKIQQYINDNFKNYKAGKLNYATLFIRDETRQSVGGYGDYSLGIELNNLGDQMRQFRINIIMIKPQDSQNTAMSLSDSFSYEYLIKCIGYDYKNKTIIKFIFIIVSNTL